jgi:hypothetical protein
VPVHHSTCPFPCPKCPWLSPRESIPRPVVHLRHPNSIKTETLEGLESYVAESRDRRHSKPLVWMECCDLDRGSIYPTCRATRVLADRYAVVSKETIHPEVCSSSIYRRDFLARRMMRARGQSRCSDLQRKRARRRDCALAYQIPSLRLYQNRHRKLHE